MEYPKNKTGILVGILLGDGYISKDGRLEIGHSINQKDYLLFKKERLKYLIYTSYREQLINNKFIQCSIRSGTTPYLRLMRKIWYKPNKQLTEKMINKINEEGLCYWYLDDGSLLFQRDKDGNIESRKGYLNTQGFTYEENLMLQKMLLNKYNIKTLIHKDKEYYRLYLNSTELKKLIKIIFPYCPPCMYYKICMRYGERKNKENLCKHSCDIKNCLFGIN